MLPDKIRVEEALVLFASFYREPASIEMLLERFGLVEKRRTFFEKLSGGQKQRLALALAMVNNPELVLLDEPTVGLDAQLRRDIYALIERFREERRTILLTTHYIEEAERLCDRVAIIDHGQVIALGTPRELVLHSGQGTRIEVSLAKPVSPDRLKQLDAVVDCREVDGQVSPARPTGRTGGGGAGALSRSRRQRPARPPHRPAHPGRRVRGDDRAADGRDDRVIGHRVIGHDPMPARGHEP